MRRYRPSLSRPLAALLLALGLSVGASTPAAAQGPLAAPPTAAAVAPAAADTALRIVLLTMGQGEAVWEMFGHNALWVHDPVRGTDFVYNYGVFDFDSPGYWGRFVRGNWIYQLGVSDIGRTMLEYQYLNRTVVAQELNLAPAEKRALRDFLERNALPENRDYRYDYYGDNCSTRIRDVLDMAAGGRLRALTADSLTATTYRWHSERLIAEDKASYLGLLAGLGPAADRPITAWEEMFLPFKVQEQVRRVQVPDERGRLVPLVASEQVIFQAAARPAERAEPPFWLPWFLLAGLAIGGLFVGLGEWARRSRAGRLGFTAIGGLWALLMGVGGLLLLGLWTLTDHSIAYRNENLFQLSPLALALLVLLPALALGARWAARPAQWVARALVAVALLGLVLQLLPGLDQVNGSLIALTLPAHLGLAWAVQRLARGVPVAADPPSPTASPARGERRGTGRRQRSARP